MGRYKLKSICLIFWLGQKRRREEKRKEEEEEEEKEEEGGGEEESRYVCFGIKCILDF